MEGENEKPGEHKTNKRMLAGSRNLPNSGEPIVKETLPRNGRLEVYYHFLCFFRRLVVHQFLFLSSFPGASNLHYKREAKGKKATAKEKIIMVNHYASLNHLWD